MSRTVRDYPVGTPLVPPEGWRGRPVAAWKPVLAAGLVTAMVVLCTLVGWLTVQGLPRRAKRPESVVAKVEKPVEPKPEPVAEKATAPEPKRDAPPVARMKAPTQAAGLTYQKDVRPILDRHCTSCHGGKNKRGGVDLSTHAGALKTVKPGKPDDSALVESIVSGNMPPKKPTAVSEAERKTLREWIAMGAKP